VDGLVRQADLDEFEQIARSATAFASPQTRISVDVRGRVAVSVGVASDEQATEADLIPPDVMHVVGVEHGEAVLRHRPRRPLDAVIKHQTVRCCDQTPLATFILAIQSCWSVQASMIMRSRFQCS
jgi:hypothetical protein